MAAIIDENGGGGVFDARIQTPCSMITCGPSQAGKTQWTLKLLRNAGRLLNPVPRNICWFYGAHTSDISQLEANPNITLVKGLPETGFEEYIIPHVPNLFVIDDLMLEVAANKQVTDLFCRRGHHSDITVILNLQDLHYAGSERKTFLRCAHYLVLFSSPLDMSSIYAVAQKIMPRRIKVFLNIFEAATRKPHSYLFIDGKQATPSEARFRTDIFDYYQRVFVVRH